MQEYRIELYRDENEIPFAVFEENTFLNVMMKLNGLVYDNNPNKVIIKRKEMFWPDRFFEVVRVYNINNNK